MLACTSRAYQRSCPPRAWLTCSTGQAVLKGLSKGSHILASGWVLLAVSHMIASNAHTHALSFPRPSHIGVEALPRKPPRLKRSAEGGRASPQHSC